MPAPRLTTIGFDADDTLWHNERFFRLTQDRLADLLSDHAARADIQDRLLAAERRNLGHYGYGIKGFMLSMIETAIEVAGPGLPGAAISEILASGREMLAHPIELLPHARETVARLAASHRVLVITKGDLMDQERKLAQSGLGDLFHGVEIVSEKTPEVYRRIFARHGSGADTAMMIGNSLRSDVLPALSAGAWGVHVPHELTWEVERAEAPAAHPRFRVLADLGLVAGLIDALET